MGGLFKDLEIYRFMVGRDKAKVGALFLGLYAFGLALALREHTVTIGIGDLELGFHYSLTTRPFSDAYYAANQQPDRVRLWVNSSSSGYRSLSERGVYSLPFKFVAGHP